MRRPLPGRVTRAGPWLWRQPATALLLYLVLAVALFRDTWVGPRSTHIGVGGDPESYLWTMRWGPFALSHLHNPFFTTYLVAPRGANLMWNAPPLPGVLMWPVTAVLGVVASYNVLATLAVALSGWCMFLALRRLMPGRLGPLIGGLLYGFSPYMIGQSLGHVVLSLAMIPPLMLLVLHEVLVRQRWAPWRSGLALGALAAAQLMTFQEMLGSEAVAAAVGVTVLAACRAREVRARLPHAGRCLGAALVAFAVISAPALRTMFLGAQRLTKGAVHPPNIFVNDLLGFVLPTVSQLFYPDASDRIVMNFTGNVSEWNGYLGVPLILLLGVAALWLRRDVLVRFAVISAVLIAILSLGPHLHLGGRDLHIPMPWAAVAHLPLMAHLLPSRLSLMMDLFVAVVTAALVQAAVSRPRARQRVAGLAAAGVALVPLLPQTSYPSTAVNVPAFFTSAAVGRIPEGSVALVAPYSGGDGLGNNTQVWQAESDFRFRMPAGYVFVPDDGGVVNGPRLTATTGAMVDIINGRPRPVLTPDLRRRMNSDLTAASVRTVIVGPELHVAEMVGFFWDLLGRPPEVVGGVFLWTGVGAASG